MIDLLASLPLAPLVQRLRTANAEELHAYVDDALARASAIESRLRVTVGEDERAARLHRSVDALIERYPDHNSRPPLFGVLVGIKDIIAVDGLPTRAGSALPPEAFEMPEATAVRRLVDAGAVVFGKTVTAEFASMSPGPTANPHDTAHTPGGSSSGSAAGVAAGYFPLALGTQTGGSVIRPAAFCGLAGFKPTYERLPADGVLAHAVSVDTVGWFTQDIEGAALAAAVLLDGWRAVTGREAADVVLGVPDGAYLDMAEPEGRAAFEEAVQRLAEHGVTVRRVPFLDDAAVVLERHRWMQDAEFAATHAERFARWPALFTGGAAAQIDRGRFVSADEHQAGLDGREELRARLHALLDAEALDALICPPAPGPAPDGLRTTGDPKMNVPWTQAGVPVAALPAGTVGPLPVGVQLVGRFRADEELLGVAQALSPLL